MNPESSYPSLRFLIEWSEIRKGRNRLPHWDANRIACFITFRLADSLPLDLLKNWRVERDQWIKENPRPWDHAAETEFHKRFSKRIDGMLDRGYGSCLLADGRFAKEVSTTLAAKDAQQYFLHSWVIMPNHVHVLMSPLEGASLPSIVGAWKRFSATRINKARGESGGIWQKDYFDRLIRDWDHFVNAARYIRRNPEKAGWKRDNLASFEAPWIERLLS